MNKARVIGLFLSLLLFVAIALSWDSAVNQSQYLGEHYASVSVRLMQAKITKRMLQKELDFSREQGKELKSVAAWNQLEQQELHNHELNSKAYVRLIEAYGELPMVYPIELSEGSIPAMDDYVGCLIDEETSLRLFHTVHTVGNRLTYQEKSYCIRGIIKAAAPLCLIQKKDEEQAYGNLELTFTDMENGVRLAETLLMQNNIFESATVLEGGFLARLLSAGIMLPAWLMTFLYLVLIWKEMWRRRTLPLQVIGLVFLLFFTFWLMQWLLELKLYIPQRFIPTNWSDFEFWQRKFSEGREAIRELSYITPYPKDILMLHAAKSCLWYLASTIIGMMILRLHRRNLHLDENSSVLVLLFTVMEVLAFLLLLRRGQFATGNAWLPRAWLLLPILLTGDIYIKNWIVRLNNSP